MRGMMHSQAKKAKNIATAVSGHSNTPSPCTSSAAHGHAPVLPCGSHHSAQSASSSASKQLTKASKISHSKTPMSTLNTTSAGSSLAHKSEHTTYTTPTTGGSNTSTASVTSKPQITQIKVLVAAVTMKPSEAVPIVTNPEEVTSHSPREAEPSLTPQEEDSSHSPEDMSDHPETAELSATSAPSIIDHAFDDNDDDDEHHIPLSCMEDAGQDKERIGQVYAAAGHSDDAEIGDMGQICAVQGRNVPEEDLNSNVQGDGHLYEVSRVLFPPSPHTLGGIHDVQQSVNIAHPGQLKLYDREEITALECSEGDMDAGLCRRHSDSTLRHIGRRYGPGSGMSRQNGSGDSDGRIDDGSAVMVQWFRDHRNRGTTPPSSNACSDISENGGGCRKSEGRSEQIHTSCRKSSVDLSESSAGESIESAECNEVSPPLGEEHGRRYGEEGEDDSRVAPGHVLHQREAQSIIHTYVDPSVDKEIIPGSWRTLPGRLVPAGNSAVVQPPLSSKIFPVSPTSAAAAAAAGLTIAGSSRNESSIQYEAALALLKQSSIIASTKHVSSNRDVQARSSNISSNPHSSMCSSYGSSSTKEPPPSLTLAFKHPQDTVEHINTYAAMPVRFGSNYIAEKGDLTSFLDVMPFHSLLGRPVGYTAVAADVVAAMIPKQQQQQQGELWTEGAAFNHYCSITPPPPPPPPPPPRIDWAVSQPADTTGSICASDATSAAAAASAAVIGCSATRSFASVVAEKPPATAVSSIPAPGLLAASALRFLTASADTVSSKKAASGLSLVGTQVTSKRGAMKAAGGRSAFRVETFSTAAGANASSLAGGCIASTKARRGSAGAPDVTRQQPRQSQGDTSLTSLGRYTSNKEQEGSRSPGSLSPSGWKSAKGKVKGNIPPHYLPQLHTLYSESLCDTSIITGCHSNSNTCSHVLHESSAGSASGPNITHTLTPDPDSCDSSDTSRVGAGGIMMPAMSLQRHQQKQQQQQYDSAAASSTAAHCPQFLWLQEKAQQKLLEPGPADVLLPQRQFHSSQLAAGFDPGFKSSSCLGAMHPSTSVDDLDRECSSLLLSSQHQGMIHNNRVGGGDASCMVSAVRRAAWWEADSSHDALAAASPEKQPYMR